MTQSGRSHCDVILHFCTLIIVRFHLTDEEPSKFHPEEAKLTSVLVMVFGALFVLMGTLMLTTAGYETWKAASSSLAMLWGGIVIIAAGRTIRKTQVLFTKPRWFAFAFFWGVMSVIGLFTGVTQNDGSKIAIFAVLQVSAVYILWRAMTPTISSGGT